MERRNDHISCLQPRKQSFTVLATTFPMVFSKRLHSLWMVFFNFTRKIGIEDRRLKEETQAFSFGFFMNREWRDALTRKHFDDDSVCLGVAGIAYEFLCVVASEFLRIFDQPVALLRRGVSNVPDVLRLMKKT